MLYIIHPNGGLLACRSFKQCGVAASSSEAVCVPSRGHTEGMIPPSYLTGTWGFT